MNILDAIRDPNLFGPWFQNRDTWASWRVFVGALFGLPIEDETLYTECTGNRPLPARQAREGYLIVGRRGGKSFICALIGVYLAAFRAYNLSRGESGVVMLLAADRRQARVLFRYVKAFIEGVPMLRPMVERETADSIFFRSAYLSNLSTATKVGSKGRIIVRGDAGSGQPLASPQRSRGIQGGKG